MPARSLSLLVLLVCILAGCERRSANPLDWKIEGASPGEMQEWLDANTAHMPDTLTTELSVCITNIKVKIRGEGPVGQSNLLCQHLNGRTVREVLIEGGTIGLDSLTARLDNESNNLLQLIKQMSDLPANEQSRQQARVDYYQRSVDQLKHELTDVERHLTELKAPTQ